LLLVEASSLANSVLTVTELANGTSLTTSGSQREAALVARDEGSRGAEGKAQCCVYVLHRLCRVNGRIVDVENQVGGRKADFLNLKLGKDFSAKARIFASSSCLEAEAICDQHSTSV
jgi:hypothetical protein